MTKTTPLFLVVNAVLFVVFGLAATAAPTVFAGQLDVSLGSASAVADFRAVYGGVSFAIAAFAVFSLRREEQRLAAVWLLTLVMDGLIFGRLLTWVTHGPGSALIFAQLGLELFAAAWGAALIKAHGAPQLRSA